MAAIIYARSRTPQMGDPRYPLRARAHSPGPPGMAIGDPLILYGGQGSRTLDPGSSFWTLSEAPNPLWYRRDLDPFWTPLLDPFLDPPWRPLYTRGHAPPWMVRMLGSFNNVRSHRCAYLGFSISSYGIEGAGSKTTHPAGSRSPYGIEGLQVCTPGFLDRLLMYRRAEGPK